MATRYHQSINEERGARRAAELRRRFRNVSKASGNRPHFGVWSTPEEGSQSRNRALLPQQKEFLIWSVVAAAVVFVAVIIF